MAGDDQAVITEEREGRDVDESIDVGRGRDALDTPTERRVPWWRRFLTSVVPPIVAVVVFVVAWQTHWASAILPDYKLPSPEAVSSEKGAEFAGGQAFSIIWTSARRAARCLASRGKRGAALGLLVATVPLVR